MRYITERLEDIIAGFVTAIIGGYIVWEAAGYKLGTLTNMGPGYFPILLGSLMLTLALVMLVTARPSTVAQPIGLDQLRGMLFLTAAFIAFAFTVEAFGMLVSVFLGVFLSALGNRNTPWLHALILAACTSGAATLIFRVGLGLQIEAY